MSKDSKIPQGDRVWVWFCSCDGRAVAVSNIDSEEFGWPGTCKACGAELSGSFEYRLVTPPSTEAGRRMSSPRVLDKLGDEAGFGDRVRTENFGDGAVTGFSMHTPNAEGMTVFVLPDGETEEMRWHACPAADPGTFTCPALELIEPPSTGVGEQE